MPIKPENKKLYPKNWKEISRRIRFDRAGGQCEFKVPAVDERGREYSARCPAHHGKPHPTTGSLVVLTVAHLDHDPTNCADNNLLAGCQRCHLRYDAGHHAKNARETRTKTKDLFSS